MLTTDLLDSDDRVDPLATLIAARPTDATLDRSWSNTRADAVLAMLEERAVVAAVPSVAARLAPRRSRRRWVALGLAAAVATVTAFGATTVLTPDEALPKAAAIERLARTAAATPSLEISPGQFIHLELVSTQEQGDARTPQVDVTNESWTDTAGTTWRRDVSRSTPVGTSYYRFPPQTPDADPFWGRRPSDYKQWPTDPAALKSYLQARLSGGDARKTTDASQQIFENLSDRFATGMTPAPLNAAMIRVLGSLPEVHTEEVSFAGRAAVKLEYRGTYTNALYFDGRSAAFLGETSPGARTVVVDHGVADSIPAEVLSRATVEASTDTPDSVNGSAPLP